MTLSGALAPAWRADTEDDHGRRPETVADPAQQARAVAPMPPPILDMLPFGVLVVDRHGMAAAWNERLLDLLGEHPARHGLEGQTCCGLLGCRAPGDPLDGRCLTELALQSGGPLPEIRLDVDWGLTRSVWATVAPLGAEARWILIQLRAADPNDRRRGSAARRDPGPKLRISVLGAMRVETPGGALAGTWLEQRPGQLLRFLVCERHRVVPTDQIAECVWSGGADSRTPNTVRHFVHVLRSKLEPERPKRGASPFILAAHGGYGLNRDAVWLDADEFERGVDAGIAAHARGEAGAEELLAHALELYRGDFLADQPYADWALVERERLRELAARGLRVLSRLALKRRDLAAATAYAHRLAEMEPFDCDVHRELLTLWLRQGRRSRAVRHYRALEHRMLRELRVRPDFRLSDLEIGGDVVALR